MYSINYVHNTVEEFNSRKCPHCRESYYYEKYSTTTCLCCPPIYKDGVNINAGNNTTTTYCHCLNCGKEFSYVDRG